MPQDLRIVFMGTPEFAVASLRHLMERGRTVVGVVTAPDKPQGRGQKVRVSPVKRFLQEVPGPKPLILQPTRLKDDQFIADLKSLEADLFIVVAFRMLPEVVWAMPTLGTFNLHASLLPQYRGAAPIHWAIINGEKETGVTTFFLRHEIDTGDIIFQKPEPIHQDDTAGQLYDRLMNSGSELVNRTVDAIENNEFPVHPQLTDGQILKTAPKIFREDCEIEWSRRSEEVYNFVRGLSPFPSAWTYWAGQKVLKIFWATIEKDLKGESGLRPGDFTIADSRLFFKTADGLLEIHELQLEGKKRMSAGDFLRGWQNN